MQELDLNKELRPVLNSSINAQTFLRYYWRKNELAVFCRNSGLPANGTKQALTGHIVRYLATGIRTAGQVHESKKPNSQALMPLTFTRATVIGPG